MITKHSKRKICSFIVMLFFGIAFFTIFIFHNAAEEKSLDPTVKTSLSLLALHDNEQSSRLLTAGEENMPADKLYFQISGLLEGSSCVYDGIITIKYQLNTASGSYSENLKNTYLKCSAGSELFADGFILNVPKENGEMIISIEGAGMIQNQDVHFIQTASVYVNDGNVRINKLPENVELLHGFAENALLGSNILQIVSFIIFIASIGNYVWCLAEERKGNSDAGLNAVSIEKPLNLLKMNLIRLDKAGDLINIAKKRNKEILVYVFSEKLSYYYVIANDVTYLYVQNLKADLPKLSKKAIKRDALTTSPYQK